jgi:Tat protein secretion system quality control protein TatD with DNase activity
MEPRFFDTHCHLDLMLSPDAAASESAALGLGLFDCGVDPRDFAAAKKRASRYPNIIAGAGLPGGSPTAAAVLPKSICFAKLLTKNAISAR